MDTLINFAPCLGNEFIITNTWTVGRDLIKHDYWIRKNSTVT